MRRGRLGAVSGALRAAAGAAESRGLNDSDKAHTGNFIEEFPYLRPRRLPAGRMNAATCAAFPMKAGRAVRAPQLEPGGRATCRTAARSVTERFRRSMFRAEDRGGL